jgi:hypothetical protein
VSLERGFDRCAFFPVRGEGARTADGTGPSKAAKAALVSSYDCIDYGTASGYAIGRGAQLPFQ